MQSTGVTAVSVGRGPHHAAPVTLWDVPSSGMSTHSGGSPATSGGVGFAFLPVLWDREGMGDLPWFGKEFQVGEGDRGRARGPEGGRDPTAGRVAASGEGGPGAAGRRGPPSPGAGALRRFPSPQPTNTLIRTPAARRVTGGAPPAAHEGHLNRPRLLRVSPDILITWKRSIYIALPN